VQPKESALLVKHEDIPGFMPPMTMLFKVDAATLKAAKPDQTITATLVQTADGFALENVKPTATSSKP
jgi:protein SCO1/2